MLQFQNIQYGYVRVEPRFGVDYVLDMVLWFKKFRPPHRFVLLFYVLGVTMREKKVSRESQNFCYWFYREGIFWFFEKATSVAL